MTVLDSKTPTGPIDGRWEKHKFDLKLVNPSNRRKFKVLVVGNPANTNALIAAECAPNVPKGEFQNMPTYAYKSAGDVV